MEHLLRLQIIIVPILLLLLVGCDEHKKTQGYIEGEFIHFSATSNGILETLSVKRGETIEKGAPLFKLESVKLDAALKSAENEVKSARAKWQDLTKGKRAEEIEILINQKIQAQAHYENALIEYERAIVLVKQGAINQSTYDMRKTAKETTKARLDEVSAALNVANLGAREDELIMAQLAIDSAEQRKREQIKMRSEIDLFALEDGTVENSYFLKGEMVMAGRPVVTLLPHKNIKVRFFIPQKKLATIALGDAVTINCDACASPFLQIKAKINYISPKAEFTPPNIYSNESKDKFTFMVEAIFLTHEHPFKPGMPVEVVL